MLQDLLLKLAWPNWLFALTVVALAGIAYLFYFRTLPPLSPGRRALSLTLRALTLSALLFLILEPALRLLFQQREKPVVAALLDNSASMRIKESYGERGDSLRIVASYLSEGTFGQRSGEGARNDSLDVRLFSFDLAARAWGGDSLRFETDGSDLSRAITTALDSLSGKNLQALVLVSDGIYNQGANPFLAARNSPVAVYTVLVGDSTTPKDLAVRRAQTNQITYVNKKLPVEVVLWQNGFDGKTVLLTVSEGERVLARRTVTLAKSGFEQKETLEIVARQAGEFNFTVSVQTLEGEVTERNNRQIVRVRVLKSKIKVLAMAGAANFDRRTLSFVADQLKDYQFTFLTEKSPGQYFEQSFRDAQPDSQDIFIFYGFPTRNSDPAQLRELMRQVTNRRVPVWWFINRDTDPAKLREFEPFLPFQAVAPLAALENRFVRLSSGGRLHPVTRLDENETVNNQIWRELPPLEIYRGIKMPAGSQVLLEPDARQPENLPPGLEPAICFAYRQQEIKYLVFNGANFSNWHFQLQEDPARDGFLVQFMERAIRWLVNRDDIHQIQIAPLQQIYNVGEPVAFSGQVYDEFYQPISDARVVATVSNKALNYSDEMIAEGNGFYRQTFSGLPEGEFSYRVEAHRNDKTIGTRSGKFTVKPFFLEFQQIPANAALMRQLARETGGEAYSPGEFIRRFPGKKLETRVQYIFSEYFLWNYWYWLGALIALLGTEWFLRKRWGLL